MIALEGKTILVTGASGFIGSHLVEQLSKIQGVQLLLLSRQVRKSKLSFVRWLQASLQDLTTNYWKRIGISKIDIVFHLGSFTPKSHKNNNNIDSIFSDNLIGTKLFLQELPSPIQRIIFSSTLDVYAPVEDGSVISETSSINPSSLYGASKLFCEKLVATWADKHNTSYAILRYGHIFGPGEEAYKKLIPLVIRDVLDGKQPSVYGQGHAERDFLYVQDAVEATIRAAKIDKNISPVNIVRGMSSSLRTIVKLIIQQSDAIVTMHFVEGTIDGYSLRFDHTKMQEELGVWPLTSLKDGLKKEILAFRSMYNAE